MKKKVLFVASIFLATATFAQDGLTSKKGEAYLPEAGDYALGFDGTPFLNYAGNLFNGNTNNTLTANWVGNTPSWTIVGKYFKDEKTAYRAKIRIGFGSTTTKNIIDTSGTSAPSTLTAELTDEKKWSHFDLTLGGGIEKRRGNTRIQGFYGAELLISLHSEHTDYTYGDTRADNHVARYTDWTMYNPSSGVVGNAATTTGNAERDVKYTPGSTFSIALRGFAGVEWFVAPKVSIAAEYGWGLAMSSTGTGERDTEEWATPQPGGTANTNIARKHNTGGGSSFGIDTDNNGGQLTIMFHF